MQDANSRINSLEYDRLATTSKKEVLDQRVMLTQSELENVTEQIAVYGDLIGEKEREIKRLEAREEAQWKLYKTRIRAMEENGPVTYYAILFGAADFADMLFRVDAIKS